MGRVVRPPPWHDGRSRLRKGLMEMNEMAVNAPAPLSGTMDVDEFMAFMETRPKGEHWDLIEGVAVMMAPASYLHQRVASSFSRSAQQRHQGERPGFVCLR